MTTKNNVQRIARISIACLVMGIGVFIYSRFHVLTSGVNVVLNNIADGMSLDGRVLHLEGNAKKASKLTINDREITIDAEGDFNDTLVFSPGLNTIRVFAEDRYKAITEKVLHIYVPEPPITIDQTVILPLPDIPEDDSEMSQTEDSVLTTEEILEETNQQ